MIAGRQNDRTAELEDRFADGRGLDQVAVKSDRLITVALIEETVVTVAGAVCRSAKNDVLGVDTDTGSERDIILRAPGGGDRTGGIAENRGIGSGVRPLHIHSGAGVVPIRGRQVPVSRTVYWWIRIRLRWIPSHTLCVSRCSTKNANDRRRQTRVTYSLFHIFLSAKTFVSDRIAYACLAIPFFTLPAGGRDRLFRRPRTTKGKAAKAALVCHWGYTA